MKKDCDDAADLLVDFLEKSLPPEVQQRLLSHMESCPPCLHFVETYRKTTTLCRQSLLQKAPTEVSDRLFSFLRQQTGGPLKPQK